MVLADPQHGWRELIPEPAGVCDDLRDIERSLRRKIYRHEHIHDDYPITDILEIPWAITVSDYGLQEVQTHIPETFAYRWDPPIKTETDFDTLRPRTIVIDREATARRQEFAMDLLGDILTVRLVGESICRAKLTRDLVHLRGLEQMMLDMYDHPQFLHRMMAFMRDEKMREWELYEREGVLSLNNGPEYMVGPGGIGHTTELPAADYAGHVRMKDMRCWAESQETVCVAPDQFLEFVLQYQLPLIERFPMVDYGCCEPLDYKLDVLIEHIPRLRAVAVSHWCNREVVADKLGNRYVYVYKPDPTTLALPSADLQAAEQELRETMELARGCCLSIVMKNTSTFCNEPERLTRWTEMASRLCQEAAG